MAKQKEVTVRGQEFTLQSVSPTWYLEQNDKHGMTGGGSRNTPGYMDVIFRNCVIKPTEVASKGMKYFDESEDVKTAIDLLKAIESFLVE